MSGEIVISGVDSEIVITGPPTEGPQGPQGPSVHGDLFGLDADDHPQYQLRDERDQPDGYAGLDASGQIVDGAIPSTIARDAEVAAAYSPLGHNHSGVYDPAGSAASAQSAAQTYADGLVDDLSGVSNQSTARTNLGLGSAATHADTDFATAGHNHAGVYDPAGSAASAQSAAQTYADSVGSLKFDKAGGTITGATGIIVPSATDIPLYLKGAASQSANLLELQDSAGAKVGYINPSGALVLGSLDQAVLGRLSAYAGTAATKGIVVRGATSQTANLFEIQNSGGTAMSYVAADGSVIIGGGTTAPAGDGTQRLVVNAESNNGFLVQYAVDGSDWFSVGKLGSGIIAFNTGGGYTLLGTATAMSARLNIGTLSAAYKGIVVRGVTAQTANLLEIQNDAGSVLASISPTGDVEVTSSTAGVILRSPDNTRWRLTVDNTGAVTTTVVP